jgi:hypothetical protein
LLLHRRPFVTNLVTFCAAEIDTNYLGLVGPGVKTLGVDGPAADAGPNSAGPNSRQTTVPGSGTTGTWVDETDIRPTLLNLAGLHDDYQSDGRVTSEILASPRRGISSPTVEALGQCYKQLNSSVGEFGTATLQASTRAIESTSAGDRQYLGTERALSLLEHAHDALAGRITAELSSAEFGRGRVDGAFELMVGCRAVLATAAHLGS